MEGDSNKLSENKVRTEYVTEFHLPFNAICIFVGSRFLYHDDQLVLSSCTCIQSKVNSSICIYIILPQVRFTHVFE